MDEQYEQATAAPGEKRNVDRRTFDEEDVREAIAAVRDRYVHPSGEWAEAKAATCDEISEALGL